MLKSTKNNYGGASTDNWKGKMMWRTLENVKDAKVFEEMEKKESPKCH